MKWICVLIISLCWLSWSDAQQTRNSRRNNDSVQSTSIPIEAGRMRTAPPLIRQPQIPASNNQEPNKMPDMDWDDYVPYQGDNQDSFDWMLAQSMMLKNSSNIIVSPFSVKLLLVLLAEASGTDTLTQKELGIILSNVRAPYVGRNLYEKIFNSLKAPSTDYEFKMGTKVYLNQYIEPTQRYAAIVEKYYDTTIERLDFKESVAAANNINGWCSNVTNGEIQHLIQPADIENSVMVMLNAIYFKGLWRRPFPTNQTTEMSFFVSNSQQVKTKFMVRTGRYYYLKSDQLNAKMLRIPYKGKKFSMLIVLPNSKEGFSEFVRQLDGVSLRREEWLMDDEEVYVALPKFKFDYLSNLKSTLEDLGIHEIFTDSASLPLLARGAGLNSQLHVSNVIQKAGIQIDEQGSTLYAATEISLVNKFGDSTKEFVANRPFVFYIQDETTGTLLFAGKITNVAELNDVE